VRGRLWLPGVRACWSVTAGLALAALVGFAGSATGQTYADRGLVVRGLSFRGNVSLPDEVLRISIATSQSSYFARSSLLRWTGLGEKQFLNETEFRRDVLRLAALYRQSGFMDVTVDTVVRRTDSDAFIQFVIYEGEPIRVVSFEVDGAESLLNRRSLLRALPLQVGDPFNRLLMQASSDTVRLRLADRGRPFAQVFRNFDTDSERRTAAIHFEVDPGPRVTIGQVAVLGTDEVDESVVRRTIVVQPGQVFRQRDLYRSQLELYRTQLFDYVSIRIVGDSQPTTDDEPVDLELRVSEAPRSRVRLGGGYGTIDCFRALGSWTLLNFLGGGRALSLSARTSQIGVGDPLSWGLERSVCPQLTQEDTTRLKLNYNLSATLHEPFVFSRRTSATLTLFAERYTEYQAFLRQAVGGDAGVTMRVTPDLPVTLGYGLSYGRTQADPATLCTYLNVCSFEDVSLFADDRLRSTLSLAATRDVRGSVLNPQSGSWVSAEVRYASPAIGSDTLVQFTKGTLELGVYRELSRTTSLHLRLRLGTILPATLSFEGQELRYVPTEERFYAGGANTVRGYGQNELGPIVRVIDTVRTSEELRDGQTVVVVDSVIRTSATGGNDLIIANAELQFRLPWFSNRLFGAVFVDAGRVFARGSEVPALTGLRVTPGVGVRVPSPLGPIRLDIALNPYPVDRSPLYARSADGTGLDLVDPEYAPRQGLLGKFQLHLSVGPAF
jgi:outer membrane protein assembly factor BamA